MLLQPSAEVLFWPFELAVPSAVRVAPALYFHWPQWYELYKDAISRSFLWGVLILGSYGVYQFFSVLRNGTAIGSIMSSPTSPSFGLPEPLQVRVFSAV